MTFHRNRAGETEGEHRVLAVGTAVLGRGFAEGVYTATEWRELPNAERGEAVAGIIVVHAWHILRAVFIAETYLGNAIHSMQSLVLGPEGAEPVMTSIDPTLALSDMGDVVGIAGGAGRGGEHVWASPPGSPAPGASGRGGPCRDFGPLE